MLLGCWQLAEKRKTLVDEMSIRGQETAEEQKKKMEEVQESLKVGRVLCDQLELHVLVLLSSSDIHRKRWRN